MNKVCTVRTSEQNKPVLCIELSFVPRGIIFPSQGFLLRTASTDQKPLTWKMPWNVIVITFQCFNIILSRAKKSDKIKLFQTFQMDIKLILLQNIFKFAGDFT